MSFMTFSSVRTRCNALRAWLAPPSPTITVRARNRLCAILDSTNVQRDYACHHCSLACQFSMQAQHCRGKMVRIALQFKANLENLTNVRPDEEDFRWYLKLQCQNCGENTKDWVYMCLAEAQAIKGSRGSANFVSKCKLCGRENTMDIIKDSIKEYMAEDSNRFKTMVAFDCRGVEPVDFSPRGGFVAEGVDTGTKFTDVNLTEKDWSDYDEKAAEAVGIYEVTHQFLKLH